MLSSPTQSCLISMRVVASRVSARWHHRLFRFSLMSATSHMHPSAPCGSSSHHWLPHWPVAQAHLVAPLSPVVICRVPSSALHHRHKSCAPDWKVLCLSCVGQQLHCLLIHWSLSRQTSCEKSTKQKRIMTVKNKLVLFWKLIL